MDINRMKWGKGNKRKMDMNFIMSLWRVEQIESS